MASSDNTIEEWKEARSVLARFDENLHDLRKYGFSVLSAFLALDALQKMTSIDAGAKFGLIVVTMALILTMRLLDQDYQKLQGAASIRARILERSLNFELTGTITHRYKRDKLYLFNFGIYCGFIAIALLIGLIILPETMYGYLLITGFIAMVILIAIYFLLRVDVIHTGTTFKEDWTIDRVSCNLGEKIRITVTNMDTGKDLVFAKDELLFTFRDEENKYTYEQIAGSEIIIPPEGNYSWLRDTSDILPDRIYRVIPRGWNVPMVRSIHVSKPKAPDFGNAPRVLVNVGEKN